MRKSLVSRRVRKSYYGEMYLNSIQDLIKMNERMISTCSIKSYRGIRWKIDNSTFSSEPFHIKLLEQNINHVKLY